MPNRIIKESICSSDTVDQLSPFEETVFYRLIVNCDDYGRMDARPKILRSKLFPLKERLPLKYVESALRALADAGCVRLYSVDSKPYLYLPSWGVHQTIRAKKSKYPEPTESNGNADENICNQLQADESICPRNPIQSESESEFDTNYVQSQDAHALFECLWERYPCKKGKGKISEKQKKKLLDIGLDEMGRAIERYRSEWEKDKAWRKEQNGSTFFSTGYIDYLDSNYAASRGKGNKGIQAKNKFNNFPQREHSPESLSSLESKLLQGTKAGCQRNGAIKGSG